MARRHRAGARHYLHPGGADPAHADMAAGYRSRHFHYPFDPHPDDRTVHPAAAGLQHLSHGAVDRHRAQAGAQSCFHPPHPRPRSRRYGSRGKGHRGLRQFRHGRQFRHRHHRLRHIGAGELHRYHQGVRAHRRGRGPVQPRCHARQTDGGRRRPFRRPHRRDRSAAAAQTSGGREHIFRRHGRRRQVRPWRRHSRSADHLHQCHRRHHHRRRPARPDTLSGLPNLHIADCRRRAGQPNSGVDRVDGRRSSGFQGGRGGLDRQGPVQPARRLSRRAWPFFVPHGLAVAAARNPDVAVHVARGPDRQPSLVHNPETNPAGSGGDDRRGGGGSGLAGGGRADLHLPAIGLHPP